MKEEHSRAEGSTTQKNSIKVCVFYSRTLDRYTAVSVLKAERIKGKITTEESALNDLVYDIVAGLFSCNKCFRKDPLL